METSTGSASGKAVTALVFGILSIFMCPLLGVVAWVLGNGELKAIAAGEAPVEGRTLASVGKVMGMVMTILMIVALAMCLVVILFFGGLAALAGLAGK